MSELKQFETDRNIKVIEKPDSDYPGVVIAIGDHEPVMVEWDSLKERYQVVVWANGDNEDPSHVIPLTMNDAGE